MKNDAAAYEHGNLFEMFKKMIKANIRQFTMIFALLIIWVIFSGLTDGLFFHQEICRTCLFRVRR